MLTFAAMCAIMEVSRQEVAGFVLHGTLSNSILCWPTSQRLGDGQPPALLPRQQSNLVAGLLSFLAIFEG